MSVSLDTAKSTGLGITNKFATAVIALLLAAASAGRRRWVEKQILSCPTCRK